MSHFTIQEELIDRDISRGNKKKAIQGLLLLVSRYSQTHDFVKAEAAREKISSIDASALSESILAQEIIDNARSTIPNRSHKEVWQELYTRFTDDEAEALQQELQEVFYPPGKIVFSQGEKNSNLYFIDAGHANHLFTQGSREIFIKRITAGNVANEESFFDAGMCTSTLLAVDSVKAYFLAAITLLTWEAYLPALEPKLREFCTTEEKISSLLAKSSLDRRIQQRVALPGRILLKVVNAAGEVVGRTIRGDIADVSVGGVSFSVETPTREQALMLLGHNLHLRFNLPPMMTEVEQIGTVLGVKLKTRGGATKNQYSVHVKFSTMLPAKSIIEAARFIKMIKIAERNK